MAARSREDLHGVWSSESRMTYTEFLQLFPTNGACLDYLKQRFYADGTPCPSCKRETKFHRIKSRSAYSCQFCGHQVYPTAGTIFHKSTVNLHLWFYAIFLMSSTRCGIAAKQLEREIGVSYPTALRMFRLIRQMLVDHNDDGPLLTGEIEADETFFGGKPRASETRATAKLSRIHAPRPYTKKPKATIFAVVERGGLSAIAHPASVLFTDEFALYRTAKTLKGQLRFARAWCRIRGLGHRFAAHHTINHSERVYVDGIIHTNTVEGFFSLFKGGVKGVYRNVSVRYLQDYVDEYAFRYNHRHTINPRPMFWNFLDRVEANRLPF